MCNISDYKSGIFLDLTDVYTQVAMSFANRNCSSELLIVSKYYKINKRTYII